jgi:hypothetical protein
MDASGFCPLLTLRIVLQDVLPDHPSILPHPTYPPHLTIFIAVSGLTLEVDHSSLVSSSLYIISKISFLNYTATQNYIVSNYFANLFPIFN